MRPPSRPNLPPPEEDYDDDVEDLAAPRRRPRKKAAKQANLGLILGLLGGAAVAVIGIIVLIIVLFSGGGGGDDRNLSFEELQRRAEENRRRLGITSAAAGQNQQQQNQGNRTPPRNRTNPDQNSGEGDNANAENKDQGSAAPTADANSGGMAAFDESANPFDGVIIGNLPAKAPRQFSTLKYLPAASDAVTGLDLEPVKNMPNLARFLRRILDPASQGQADQPLAKLLKELDGNPVLELAQGTKFGPLSMNVAAAGKALEFSTTVVRLQNPVDSSNLVRAVQGDAIPNLDGLKCFGLPAQEVMGTRFSFYLCFPDDEPNVVILAQAQQADLDTLVRRGGDFGPAISSILANVDPAHFFVAVSLEPMKSMLPMLGMMAGQAPPEVQAILKEVPKSTGLVAQLRLQNNQAKVDVGLTFPNDGQALGMNSQLNGAWTKLIQPQISTMASGMNSKALDDLVKNVKMSARRSAALVSSQISIPALKEDYPQIVAAMGSLPNMANAIPGGGMPTAGRPPAENPPDSASGSMSTGGRKSKSNPNAPFGVKEGNRVPEIAGKDLDGKEMKLSDYRGKVVMLDFWAFWCGPCVSMFPHNRELVEKYKNRPFAIVGVNADRTKGDISNGLRQHKITWRSFDDGTVGNKIVSKLAIRAFPTMMLIDGNGVIRKIIVGAGPQNTQVLDKTIAELVKELE